MRGTMWLLALSCGIVFSSSGCCGFLGRGGCGGGCGCESCARCDDDCCPTCGTARHSRRQRVDSDDGDEGGTCSRGGACGARANCGECGDECGTCSTCGTRKSCGECGDECGTCCHSNFCFHPFRWIGKLFYSGTWCGPSCGDTYWGEGISDPPACHDPCNCNGHWTGNGGCASCNHEGGYEGSEGYSTGSTGRRGCASCNRGGGYQGGDAPSAAEAAPADDDAGLEPTPAPKAAAKTPRRAADDNYQR